MWGKSYSRNLIPDPSFRDVVPDPGSGSFRHQLIAEMIRKVHLHLKVWRLIFFLSDRLLTIFSPGTFEKHIYIFYFLFKQLQKKFQIKIDPRKKKKILNFLFKLLSKKKIWNEICNDLQIKTQEKSLCRGGQSFFAKAGGGGQNKYVRAPLPTPVMGKNSKILMYHDFIICLGSCMFLKTFQISINICRN